MPILRSYHYGQPEYAVIQKSVSTHFFEHHRARPDPWPEEFWSLIGPGQSVPGQACLGLCWGDHGALFSEHYLPKQRVCSDEERRALVEVGQVVSFVPGAGSRLLKLIIATLAQRNFRYAIMTTTTHVRTIMGALGIPFTELGRAERRLCRDAHIDWGSYYQNDPRVILIDLQLLDRASTCDGPKSRSAAARPQMASSVNSFAAHPLPTSLGVSNVISTRNA